MERRLRRRDRRRFRRPLVRRDRHKGEGRRGALQLRGISAAHRGRPRRLEGDALQQYVRHHDGEIFLQQRHPLRRLRLSCFRTRATPTRTASARWAAIRSCPAPNNKILRIWWTGLKIALRDDLDVAGGYYHYWQNDYNTSSCTDGGLSAPSCRDTLNAVSAMIDYYPWKRVDAYAGVLWSQVTGGLASGYLYTINFGRRSACGSGFRIIRSIQPSPDRRDDTSTGVNFDQPLIHSIPMQLPATRAFGNRSRGELIHSMDLGSQVPAISTNNQSGGGGGCFGFGPKARWVSR